LSTFKPFNRTSKDLAFKYLEVIVDWKNTAVMQNQSCVKALVDSIENT